MALRPGDVFAGYEILSLVGRGGMGQVYLVQNPHLHRPEALKVISAAVADNSDFHRRFTQEARTAAALNHPAIVTVHHFGVEDGSPWFTMSYLDGATAAESELTREEILQVTWQISAALDYAHRRHVIHRDIKPANIVITRDDVDRTIDRAVILDFGIARLVNATTFTATNAFIGTLAYTAPEIIDGHSASAASDQYSLACTIYELLSGSSPFVDTAPSALMMAHLSKPVARLGDRDPSLARFDAALGRALAKDPTQRFPDCRSFASALAQPIESERQHTAQATQIPTRPTQPAPAAPAGAKTPTDLVKTKMPPQRRPTAVASHPTYLLPPSASSEHLHATTIGGSPLRSEDRREVAANTSGPARPHHRKRIRIAIATVVACTIVALVGVSIYVFIRPTDPLNSISAATTDGTTVCAISSGIAYCWGDNTQGQVGDGTTTDVVSPRRVENLTDVTSISTNLGTTCAVAGGIPYCWGADVAATDTDETLRPVRVTSLANVSQIQTAGGTTCAIAGGRVNCWGTSTYGQSGTSATEAAEPNPLPRLNQATDVAVGGNTACAINDGDPYCWGSNSSGQLGSNQLPSSRTPHLIGLLSVSQISTSGGTTCAISDETPYCWGNNSYGQLGDGTTAPSNGPQPIPALPSATRISTSGGTSCAISDGAPYCWGTNSFGQIGDGSTSNAIRPSRVTHVDYADEIIVGSGTTCAITDGELRCWGQISFGE